ncbi:MAG: AMP-binding protein [Oscillospiraceae bacterium]|jgi:phenylacetate-coenzyme A ligase PaaK-like adenylate-forming protein|nr:AMP-binding protein [Oscillospiraceae bacterium]
MSQLDIIAMSDCGASTHAAIAEYQLAKLRETVAQARKSRFYGERLRKIPEIATLSDLAALPFTTPADLTEPHELLCVSPADVGRIVTLPTSGTTGKPKRVFFTADDLARTLKYFQFGISPLTRPNSRVMVFFPPSAPDGLSDLLVRALALNACDATVLGAFESACAALDALNLSRATCAVGFPAQLLELARTGSAPCIEYVLLCSDYISPAVVQSIEKAWNCNVFAHYGLTESGYGIGVECEQHDGLHLRETDLLVEIVNPESGAPLPDGEFGEVVFTTLTRRAMPLIRYRTGDRGRLLTGQCPCGSKLKRLDRHITRLSSGVEIAGGRVTMPMLDDAIFPLGRVRAFDATMTTRGGTDNLVVRIEHNGGGSTLSQVAETLREILIIGNAIQSENLNLTVIAEPIRRIGAAKREIVDLRGK